MAGGRGVMGLIERGAHGSVSQNVAIGYKSVGAQRNTRLTRLPFGSYSLLVYIEAIASGTVSLNAFLPDEGWGDATGAQEDEAIQVSDGTWQFTSADDGTYKRIDFANTAWIGSAFRTFMVAPALLYLKFDATGPTNDYALALIPTGADRGI